jgi:hypothetical protein
LSVLFQECSKALSIVPKHNWSILDAAGRTSSVEFQSWARAIREAGMLDSPLPMTAASIEYTPPEQPCRSQPRGRVCNRAGCGQLIVGRDGRPRYDRNFCSSDCRRADKRERMQEKRRKAKTGRCPHCGRKTGEDPLSDGRVPRHNASSIVAAQMVRGEEPGEQSASVNRL